MIIAEDLLLLLHKDDGKPATHTASAYGYAAAHIADLVAGGHLSLSDDRDPRVTVIDPTPPAHPALDAALLRIQARDGAKISALVADTKVAATEEIAASLAAAGVIKIEEKTFLGLVPERYPVLDEQPEKELRARLKVGLDGGPIGPRERILLALVRGLDAGPRVFAEEWTGSGRDLKRRLDLIIEDTQADAAVDEAVRKAINAARTTATMIAVMPAIIAASTSN